VIIKNISARALSFDENFPTERPLLPGDTVDLSKYPRALVEQNQTIKQWFDKGLALCLGRARTTSKLRANPTSQKLGKYQFKSEDFNQGTIVVPKKVYKPEIISSTDRRTYIAKIPTTPERYNTEALNQYAVDSEQARVTGQVPEFAEKTFETPKTGSFTQIQNEDEILTVQLDEETGVSYVSPLPGQIPSKHTKDPSVFVDQHVYKTENDKDFDPSKISPELQAKLDKRMIQIVEKKCLSPKHDGKPCNATVLTGYNTCWKHLTSQDRERYLKTKKVVVPPPQTDPKDI
jgi:hypothetical protein